jgi:hypothetical protein
MQIHLKKKISLFCHGQVTDVDTVQVMPLE